jgi:ATP-dependent Zn protease
MGGQAAFPDDFALSSLASLSAQSLSVCGASRMDGATTTRRHQAVHEAGHAVIGTTLGLHVSRVGFNTRDERRDGSNAIHFAASTQFADAGGDTCELIAAKPDLMIIVLMAGTAAEHIVLDCQLPESHHGDLAALKFCYPDFPDDPTELLNAAAVKALRLAEANRAEINAVADQLLAVDELDGGEVLSIIERTHGRTS